VQNRQNLDHRLISQKSSDLLAKFLNNPNNELFPMVNPVHRVHISVDRPGVLGPPWIDAGADRGHGGTLTGAWPPTAPVHGCSPVRAQQREGNVGNSARASPGLRRH
jgi:hypothetical protein